MGPVQEILKQKLEESFVPVVLKIINESPNHNVPDGSESHFRVVIVSQKFEGLSTVKRHQLIYKVVSEELKDKIHAFSQHTFTPEEWIQKGGEVPPAPPCAKK